MATAPKLTAVPDPPDIMRCTAEGFFSPEAAKAALEELKAAGKGMDRVYLIMDLTRVTGLDPRARKIAAEVMADFPLVGTVLIGASFPVRVVIHFVNGVGKLIHGKDRPFAFVSNEAEALAWVDAERRTRSSRV